MSNDSTLFRRSSLCLSGLFLAAFSLATWLEPWFQSWSGSRTASANVLTIALGDSRRLFAKHAYVKADAYFHSGYYPSIYDTRPAVGDMHMTAHARNKQHSDNDESYLGKPKDWIDAFSRHFYPNVHRHLGEGPGHNQGEEREILPWLQLAATLDPDQTETYLVAAYWLRMRLGQVREAELFLREGLRAKPGDCDLLFELGRIYYENHHDRNRARNLWELALRKWHEQREGKSEGSMFVYAQILGRLAWLEEEEENYGKALEYLTLLKPHSPNQAGLEKWMRDLKEKMGQAR